MIKIKLWFSLAIVVLALCFSALAHANLELELTQGVNGTIPVAMLPFKHEKVPYAQELQQVVHDDLQHSGRFKVVTALGANAANTDRLDFSYWQAHGVDDLLQGQLTYDKETVQIHLSLYDSYKESHVIGGITLTAKVEAWRDLAHRISDWVYEQLTGERGIFSTRLCYVVVLQKPGSQPKYRLQVADSDGARARLLLESSEPIMSPAWSPDGQKIAYVSFEAQHAQIYEINLPTGQRHLLTDFPGVNGAPSWSPDGKRLALVLSHEHFPNIYIYDLEKNRLSQLTHSLAIDTEPQWSPDQKFIAFTSDRGGHAQVYRIEVATGQIERLTFEGSFHARPQFTADNKHLITLHRANGLYNIALQDLESGRMRLLTQTGQASSPSVSPNGQMVVYAAKRGGRGVLEMVAVDAKVTWRLPASEGDVQEPAWSPFLTT